MRTEKLEEFQDEIINELTFEETIELLYMLHAHLEQNGHKAVKEWV